MFFNHKLFIVPPVTNVNQEIKVSDNIIDFDVTYNPHTLEYVIKKDGWKCFTMCEDYFYNIYERCYKSVLSQLPAFLHWYLSTYEKIDIMKNLKSSSISVIVRY